MSLINKIAKLLQLTPSRGATPAESQTAYRLAARLAGKLGYHVGELGPETFTPHQHEWFHTSRVGEFRILDCACGMRRRVRIGMNGFETAESVEVNPGGSVANCLNVPEDLDFTRSPMALG